MKRLSSKPRRIVKPKRKSKRYDDADIQRAYNKGYREGRKAEAIGSHRDW